MRMGIRVACTTLVLTLVCAAGATNARDQDDPGFLRGSWTSAISPRNCVSGDALAPALTGITTFHQGGTLTESREVFPGTARGPGHGTWHRTGKRTFAVKIVFQRFDLNGFLIGTQEIVSTNTVSRDSRSALIAATFKILDSSGVTLASGCAAGEAQRIVF